MYIKQVIENRESWWGYILTVILIVPVVVFLFSIPHGIILTSKAFGDEELMAKIAVSYTHLTLPTKRIV